MRKLAGMTLIELMTTLAVVVVLATLAAPSLAGLRLDAGRTAAVNAFLHALFLARSESIKRFQVVSVCRSLDAQGCAPSSAEWAAGWIVFVNGDADDPPVRDSDEPLLLANEGWPGGRITSNRGAYSFRPYRQGVVNGTVTFCDSRGATEARAIIISHTGRPRVSRLDASNKPLRCAPTST